MTNPNEAILHQINRLKDSLEKDGYEKEAKSLEGLLSSSQASLEMSPSKIQQSFVATMGETLTAKTPIPVDKETSTPLAEVFFPAELPGDMPLFDDNIQLAIQSIVNEWMKFEKLLVKFYLKKENLLLFLWLLNKLLIPFMSRVMPCCANL